MATVIFWTCCSLLLYVYIVYPILVRALAARIGRPVARSTRLPPVTIIVTVYNEEASILEKLDNLSSLNYPEDLLDIIVVSDGSTDATEAIASHYVRRRVQVLRVEGRQGKTACQNTAVARATGEILLFTDATTHLRQDALHNLVENFADDQVGCVGGTLFYVSDLESATGRGGAMYWSYELRLRAAESSFGSMIGVSGCLYAVRRRAYRPINPGLISDFVIAMRMHEQGLRTVLAPNAICFENTLEHGSLELAMRTRVAVRSLNALIRERQFLNPFRYGRFAWQLWSHKLLRYASPLLWIGALVSNLALLDQPAYVALFAAQIVIMGAGSVGFFLQGRQQKLGVFGQPYYFLLTNIAALLATMRYLRGERMVTWTPIR